MKQQILELERHEAQTREHDENLESIRESLTEVTGVSGDNVAAVLRNLEEEKSVSTGNLFPFTTPTVAPVYKRIAIYSVAGFLAFSAFKSSQIRQVQQESRYDHRTMNFKVAFSADVGLVKSLLSDAQRYHYKLHGRFAATPEGLNELYRRTTRSIESYSFVSEFNVLEDGSMKIYLTDKFGYDRWLALTPKLYTGARSNQVVFDCTSNAEPNLLRFNHGAWCTHIKT